MHGDFVSIGLFSHDVEVSQSFYHHVFDWEFEKNTPEYNIVTISGIPAATISKMPLLLQRMKMSAFWMINIDVDDLPSSIARAKTLGGKVEYKAQAMGGQMAMILDPAGAGFIGYHGSKKTNPDQPQRHGLWTGSELFTSDLDRVKNFYEQLFHWTFKPSKINTTHRYDIINRRGKTIGAVNLLEDNHEKNKKDYWGVFFSVENIQNIRKQVEENGGTTKFDSSNSDGEHLLVKDPHGARFYILKSPASKHRQLREKIKWSKPAKWRTILALILIYLAIFLNLYWILGLMLLLWAIPDLRNGTTYFIEPLRREEHPFAYWAIILTWIGLSVFLLSYTWFR